MRADPLAVFLPSRVWAEAIADPAHHQLWRACNRVGKSYHMAYMLAREAVDRPGYRGRWIGPTRAQCRAVGQRYLSHFLAGRLDDRSAYAPGTGFNRHGTALLRNGSIIEFRSLEDGASSHEGAEFDRIVFDEPPTIPHLNANTGRTGPGREGKITIGATMVNRGRDDLERLRAVVEGAEDLPETGPGRHEMPTKWVQYVAEWTRDNVPWLTDEQYRRQRDKWTGTLEEPQRLRGAWEGAASSRAFSYFSGDHVLDDEADRKCREWPLYVLGIDHGQGMGKQIAALLGVDPVGPRGRPEFYLMREWVGAGANTPEVDARGILDMLAEVGVSPYAVSAARGDVGSGEESRRGVIGASRNGWIEAQIATLLGTRRAPFRIDVPSKAPGAWRVGEIALNHALKDNRFHVHRSCHRFISCAQTYQGSTTRADRDRKDGIDAVRYAAQDWLIEQRGGVWAPLFMR